MSADGAAQYVIARYRTGCAVAAAYGPLLESPLWPTIAAAADAPAKAMAKPVELNAAASATSSQTTSPSQPQPLQEAGEGADADDLRFVREGTAALALLRSLTSRGAHVAPDSLLLMACRAGHNEVVREVLSRAAAVRAESGGRGETLSLSKGLHVALEHAQHQRRTEELVTMLERAGAQSTQQSRCVSLTRNHKHGHVAAALYLAAADRPGGGVRANQEVFIDAACRGNGDMVEALMEAGVVPERSALNSAIYSVTRTGLEAIVPLLLRAGADRRDGGVLVVAAEQGRLAALRTMLAAGAYEARHPHLQRALEAVCDRLKTHPRAVHAAVELLRAGADPAPLCNDRRTALSSPATKALGGAELAELMSRMHPGGDGSPAPQPSLV